MSSHSLSLRKMKLLLLPHGCLNSCLLVLKTPNQILFLTQQSSNINEVIRAVLNFFFYFNKKILHTQKAQKAQKAQKTKSTKRHQKAPKAPKAQKSTKTQPTKSTKRK